MEPLEHFGIPHSSLIFELSGASGLKPGGGVWSHETLTRALPTIASAAPFFVGQRLFRGVVSCLPKMFIITPSHGI